MNKGSRNMSKFEETKLLRHPTVERAYNVMRTFFEGGDDWAKQAVRAGEAITASAKNPDPDAIAASVLMNGMIVSYEPEQFETSVSPKAAEYLKKFYELDLEKPKFSTAGEQQALLGQSIVGLEDLAAEIKSGSVQHFIEYRNAKQLLDANDRALQALARKTTEKEMLAVAQTKYVEAHQALDDVVTRHQTQLAFEKTGLPGHPVVRAVYEEMKAWALDGDPLGGYARTNADIAKVLVETNATQDPEVIAAALLNQYSVLRGSKNPSEFSPRIGDLYKQSSPWARFGKEDGEAAPKTEEALTIRHAAAVHFLERMVEGYKDYAQHKDRFEPAHAAITLENIEDMKDKAAAAAQEQSHPGLKARLEKAVQAADALMNAPENTRIRKPGSPKIDRGW